LPTSRAPPRDLDASPLTDLEFGQFQRLMRQIAGISLSDGKKALVSGRLSKRLRELKLGSYSDYLALIGRTGAQDELQMVVDLLTTNETFFFREETHFDFLREYACARPPARGMFRAWSAACSSGEEAYSIAMVLAECLGDGPWEVVGSDISRRVLAAAAEGHYPMERSKSIPDRLLHRYCLKGIGGREGSFAIAPALRNRVQFVHVNLNSAVAGLGSFDVVFLRNVMIYFDAATRREVVARVGAFLKPGGYLLVGHSESLHGITDVLVPAGPSIYRRP
jgi:chemotaxis protein methyltransferase CheR